ncbi:hypothetical protein BH23ACT9_BH23ACT9_19440 [soil metagenome]
MFASPTPTRAASDRGSIPIALLAIISLTAVVGALVATTVGGSRAARFDQQYTEVIQVADAGAQEGAQNLLRARTVAELQGRAVGYTYSGAGVLDGVPYTWTATKRGPLSWEVLGTATTPAVAGVAPVTRDVTIQVNDRPRFFLAAFSDESFIMRGNNAANSYGPSYGYGATENGIVASNGTIRLNGASTTVDGVHLYNFEELPDLNRCDASGGSGCNDVQAIDGPRFPSAIFDERLEVGDNLDLDTRFITEMLASAQCPNPLVSFTAGSDTTIGTAGTHTILCYENFTVGRAVTLNVAGTVEVYVNGVISIGNSARVNCPGCNSSTATPDSTRLQFYSTGGDVRIGNQTYIAAGIYAPLSRCGGNPSSAQADIFGSLICKAITNQGGWAFHFDDALASIGSGEYQLQAWRER